MKEKYGETSHENSLDKYLARVEDLYKKGIISRGKYNKLKMQTKDIPDGFINRDLGNTQYIASFARTMLETLCKNVIATTGSVTDALREDWQLIDVMKELDWDNRITSYNVCYTKLLRPGHLYLAIIIPHTPAQR